MRILTQARRPSVEGEEGAGDAERAQARSERIEFGDARDGPETHAVEPRFALERRQHEGARKSRVVQPLEQALRVALVGEGPGLHVERGGRRLRAARELIRDARSQRPHFDRSEEHTSELQSLTNLVCRLLLEKKKQKQ